MSWSFPLTIQCEYLIYLLIIYICYHSYHYIKSLQTIKFDTKQYVLVTGCDSGMGLLLAETLHGMGWSVLAACLTNEGIQHLTKTCPGSNLHAFQCDITKVEDRERAHKLVVTRASGRLHALVNNAGILPQGPLDWVSIEDYHKVADVNLWGHISMTHLMMDALVEAKGRVINVTSTGGFLALPGQGVYCISKYGLEAYSDVLRREMYNFGVKVCIIQPCTMNTGMIRNLAELSERTWAKASPTARNRWGEAFAVESRKLLAQATTVAEAPSKVVNAMLHAITSRYPRTHYRPGIVAPLIYFLVYYFPVSVQDWIITKTVAQADHLIAQRHI